MSWNSLGLQEIIRPGNEENREYALTLSGIPMAKATQDWENRIGRRVTLRDLHILSAVVRWGSMAKAAARLATSQSAVSEAIANLEDALHVRLLDRSAQGIEPTIYANALLKRSHAVFDELKQGIKDIEFLSDPEAGEVRIASPDFLSAWLLPVAIERLSRDRPQISIRVIQHDATTLEFRELQERSVDLVITRIPKAFKDDDLETEVLLDDTHFVVAGAQSRWARRPSITLAELADEPWLLTSNPTADAVLQEAFEAQGLKAPSERVIAASVLLRVHLLATGRFLSVLSDSVLRGVAKQLSFKVLPIDLRIKAPPVAIVRLKNRTMSPVVQLFIDHLREVAKSASAPPD
jgi:DNA-binding transcriptional LysR family regulator